MMDHISGGEHENPWLFLDETPVVAKRGQA